MSFEFLISSTDFRDKRTTDLSYAEALVALDITSLYERWQASSKALFDHATGPPIAPETRDTSNYRFVRQIGLKTLSLWKTVLIISNNF